MDRRKLPRISSKLLTQFKVISHKSVEDGAFDASQGKIANLNTEGAFVEGHFEVEKGDIIMMTLQMPATNKTIETKCEVVWVNSGDKLPGFGVQFLDSTTENLDIIMKYLDAQFKSESWKRQAQIFYEAKGGES